MKDCSQYEYPHQLFWGPSEWHIIFKIDHFVVDVKATGHKRENSNQVFLTTQFDTKINELVKIIYYDLHAQIKSNVPMHIHNWILSALVSQISEN